MVGGSAPDAAAPEHGRWLRAGVIGSPHGLDGSFHVIEGRPVLLIQGATVSVAGRQREIVRRAGTDRRPILRLEGFQDRAAALAVRGEEMLGERQAAPELGENEWWAEDLEGCSVHDGSRVIGVVGRVLALPSCEVLEVRRSGDATDLLVPLIFDAVRAVDIDQRRIDVDLAFLGAG